MGTPRNQKGEVYVVQAQTVSLVKIGVANRAETRLTELQMSGPDRLRVLAIIPADDAQGLEQRLHAKFSWLRVHGEWFRPAPIFLGAIEDDPRNDPQRVQACQAALDAVIERHARKLKKIGGRIVDNMPAFWPGGPEEEKVRVW